MRFTIFFSSLLFFTFNAFSCNHLELDQDVNNQLLMGKKSKFYDAYKQGKCVLENALEPLLGSYLSRMVISHILHSSLKESQFGKLVNL